MHPAVIAIARPKLPPMAPAAPMSAATLADVEAGLRRTATLAILAERLERAARESV